VAEPLALPNEAPPAQWRRVVVGATVGAAFLNLMINTGVGLVSARGVHGVPLWGLGVVHPSVITDSLGTLISLPLLTCLICTAVLRRDPNLPVLAPSVIGRLSSLANLSLGRRALRMAAVTLLVAGPPAVLVLELAARSGLSHNGFVVYHVVLTVALGTIVTPVVALVALTERRR
jgi:hypothetical protein